MNTVKLKSLPTASRDIDAIIVGGGLAGLLAATRLAQAGRSVRVFEQAGHFGGRAITNEIQGVQFNLGPHALYAQGHAARLLTEMQVPFSGHFPSPGRPLVTLGNRSFRLPTGLVSLVRSRLLTLTEKRTLARLLGSLPRMDTRQFDRTSVRSWIDRTAGQGNLALLLAALIRVSTYVSDTDRMSAGMALDQLRTALAGNVYYLDHGWQSIVDALRNAATARGAELRASARVQSVASDGQIVTVQLAGGETVRARAAILAVEPEVACRLLQLPAGAPLVQWIGRQVSVPAASLDLALDRLPRPKDRFALGLDSPTYFSVHSAAAQLGPPNLHVLHVMKYLRGDVHESATAVQAELESFLDQVQPGWQTHLVARRYLPRITVTQAVPLAADGGGVGRPDVASAEHANVFLAGDWVGPAAMLADAAAASADDAARAALSSIIRQDAALDRENVLYART